MKLKLADFASLAEVVSSVAVLITLVFLVMGIRENTEITRASVFESNINSLMQWRSQIAQDPEIAAMMSGAIDADSLDRVDQYRLIQMTANGLSIYEKAYYSAREYGVKRSPGNEGMGAELSVMDVHRTKPAQGLSYAFALVIVARTVVADDEDIERR